MTRRDVLTRLGIVAAVVAAPLGVKHVVEHWDDVAAQSTAFGWQEYGLSFGFSQEALEEHPEYFAHVAEYLATAARNTADNHNLNEIADGRVTLSFRGRNRQTWQHPISRTTI